MSKHTKTVDAADKVNDVMSPASKSSAHTSSVLSETLHDSLSLFDNAQNLGTTPNFEAALAELEAIVSSMESDELALDLSLAAYKRGTELLQLCQKTLADAEQQIQILSETNQLQTYTSSTSPNSTNHNSTSTDTTTPNNYE